jgi:predicted amidohydrolase
MRRATRVGLLAALLFCAAFPVFCLRVAVVQLRIDESTYSSLESFRRTVTAAVEKAVDEAPEGSRPDLIVFPEYTSVFLALLPYEHDLRGAASVAEGLARLSAAAGQIGSLRQVFLEQASMVQDLACEVFGGLARQYGVAIVAGTAFARVAGEATDTDGGAGGTVELRNRAFVFGRDGRLAYTQDKVYLTEFETDVVGLSPGRVIEAAPFTIAGARIGLTLCRDTFFDAWEERFRGLDLWIDMKANGVPFTAEEREGFARALPARLPGAGVRHGITACLVGRFLDLSWEGESSIVECTRGMVMVRVSASSAREAEILRAEVGGTEGGIPWRK